MRGRRLAAFAACGLAYAGLALAPAHGAAPGPTRVLVRAEEYNLLVSQLKVNPGDAIVQLYNAGEDSHDLQIQRVGDGGQFSIGELPPGEVGEVALHLRRDSRYVMWCSLPNHRELGMEASLRVRRKRR
jgi:uncharacterized cupredoxin-like copper-binding protein